VQQPTSVNIPLSYLFIWLRREMSTGLKQSEPYLHPTKMQLSLTFFDGQEGEDELSFSAARRWTMKRF
jgi:hypothetical protein